MVDFNTENIFNADKSNIMIIRVIEKDYYVTESLEKYYRLKLTSNKPPAHIVKASIKSLFDTLRANIKALSEDIYLEIKEFLDNKEIEDYIKAYELMGDWLFKTGVIKFVNLKKYNPRDPIDEAISKGVA